MRASIREAILMCIESKTEESIPICIPVGVDVPKFVEILRSMFSTEHVHIRELVQNSLEAIHKAVTNGHISDGRISVDSDAGILRVVDDGIGMTREELITKLTQVFVSGWPSPEAESLGIGQFGFGFFSVFLVSDFVRVISRSRNDLLVAYEWTLDVKDRGANIRQYTNSLPDFGTTVEIHFRPSEIYGTNLDFMLQQLRRIYLYTAHPVWVYKSPSGIPSRAGWLHAMQHPDPSLDIGPWLRNRYKWNAIPIYAAAHRAGNGGWLTIVPPDTVPPPIEVYRRGIRVTEDRLLPFPFDTFMCGLVDVEDVNVKPDRETLRDDEHLNRLKTELMTEAIRLLTSMTSSDPPALRTVFKTHKHALTVAMAQLPELRKGLGMYFPIIPWIGNEIGQNTPERESDLARTIQGQKTPCLLWSRDEVTDNALLDRYVHLGHQPIIVRDRESAALLRLICQDQGISFQNISAQYIHEMRRSEVKDTKLSLLFRTRLPSGWDIVCGDDIDSRYPVRIVPMDASRNALVDFAGQATSENAKENGSAVLLVNVRNPIIQKLRDGNFHEPERVANTLVFIARLSSPFAREIYDETQEFTNDILMLLENINSTKLGNDSSI